MKINFLFKRAFSHGMHYTVVCKINRARILNFLFLILRENGKKISILLILLIGGSENLKSSVKLFILRLAQTLMNKPIKILIVKELLYSFSRICIKLYNHIYFSLCALVCVSIWILLYHFYSLCVFFNLCTSWVCVCVCVFFTCMLVCVCFLVCLSICLSFVLIF